MPDSSVFKGIMIKGLLAPNLSFLNYFMDDNIEFHSMAKDGNVQTFAI